MATKATGQRWVIKQGRRRITSEMSPEEIKAAITEQRAMVDAALGGMPAPPSLKRTWRRLARGQQEEQPDE